MSTNIIMIKLLTHLGITTQNQLVDLFDSN